MLVSWDAHGRRRNVVVDTTPDFRQQALTAGFKWLDAVIYTHAHADHIMGLDDIRPFNYGRQERIPVYATLETMQVVQNAFPYAFIEKKAHPGGLPRVEPHVINGSPIELYGLEFKPTPVWHGKAKILGFRFGRAAYLTDQSDIPEESIPLLEDLDVLFLDALRRLPHPSHSSIDQALAWVKRLRPKKAYFTHICHDLSHAQTNSELPEGVELAYDGLVIEVAA